MDRQLYNDKNISNEISLSKAFFGGVDIAIDVKVKVICESDTDSIINQYIIFSKVYDEEEVMRSISKVSVMRKHKKQRRTMPAGF